jgi:hypothetical protein
MKTLHPEYLIDEKKNKKAVLIPFREWKKIVEDIEELDEIRAYDKAKLKKLKFVPFDKILKDVK